MAHAWSQYRLQRSREKLAEGGKAPRIEVSRYWLYGESYYVISDGNHRTIAAREAGKRVLAYINSESWCRPADFYFSKGCIWRKHDVGWYIPNLEQSEDVDLRELVDLLEKQEQGDVR